MWPKYSVHHTLYNQPLGLSSGAFSFASRGVLELRPVWPKFSVYHTISLWGYLLEASFCSCCGLLEFRAMWPKCSVYHTIGLWDYLLELSFSHLSVYLSFGRCGLSAAYTTHLASGIIFCSCLFHNLWLTRISAHAAQVDCIAYNRPLGLSSGAFFFASRGVLEFWPMWPKYSVYHTISLWGYLVEASFCSCCVCSNFGPCGPSGAYTIQSPSGVIFWSLPFRISRCI
jgi:hypothetical protein